jgi:hypothetical protein
VLELSTGVGDPDPPDDAMVALAAELMEFAVANGETLLDLIYGHYRYAEENGHLGFWQVPARLRRDQVLSEVKSVQLVVCRRRAKYEASVFVNPNWDVEHKLDLTYHEGKIVAANGVRFVLDGDILLLHS